MRLMKGDENAKYFYIFKKLAKSRTFCIF